MKATNKTLGGSGSMKRTDVLAAERARKHILESLQKDIEMYDKIKYLPLPLLLPMAYSMLELINRYNEYVIKQTQKGFEFPIEYEFALSIAMLFDIATTHYLCVKSRESKDKYALEKRKKLLLRAKAAIQADRDEAHYYEEKQADIKEFNLYKNGTTPADILCEETLNNLIGKAIEEHQKLTVEESSKVMEYKNRRHQ